MQRILYITASPKGPASICRTFAQDVLARLIQRQPAATVQHRDLAASPPPFVDSGFCDAIMDPAGEATAFTASETLIDELDSADTVVIATPMHNYTVPAVLKAWIDQVVRIHRSFVSTPSGKIGKLADRPVFIIVASGGWFTGPSPTGSPAQPDFLTPYLTAVLNTIGLMQIQILALEGVARGPEIRDRAFTLARRSLDSILPDCGSIQRDSPPPTAGTRTGSLSTPPPPPRETRRLDDHDSISAMS